MCQLDKEKLCGKVKHEPRTKALLQFGKINTIFMETLSSYFRLYPGSSMLETSNLVLKGFSLKHYNTVGQKHFFGDMPK